MYCYDCGSYDCLHTATEVRRSAESPREPIRTFEPGDKIQAIKWLRAATGWGLKESKDAVEALWTAKKDDIISQYVYNNLRSSHSDAMERIAYLEGALAGDEQEIQSLNLEMTKLRAQNELLRELLRERMQ